MQLQKLPEYDTILDEKRSYGSRPCVYTASFCLLVRICNKAVLYCKTVLCPEMRSSRQKPVYSHILEPGQKPEPGQKQKLGQKQELEGHLSGL